MFDLIEADHVLFGLTRGECCENGMGVGFCAPLCNGDEINDDLVKILKTDSYYSTINFAKPPKSADCLIAVKCGENEYSIYVVELRGVNSTRHVRPEEIREKFETILLDFMGNIYKSVFVDLDYKLNMFKLWLVTDPLMCLGLSVEEYNKKMKGTVLGRYESLRPYKFRNKIAFIMPMLPGVMIEL